MLIERIENGDIDLAIVTQVSSHGSASVIRRERLFWVTSGRHATHEQAPLPLALGRTQEESAIYSAQQTQAGVNSTADSILGGALNATLSSRINKLFGGGSVKIDPNFVSGTGNSTARITVQQQISKSGTVTYATNVNSTAQQLIQGQYNLTPDISVVAVRDESGVFSLEMKLHRRYR